MSSLFGFGVAALGALFAGATAGRARVPAAGEGARAPGVGRPAAAGALPAGALGAATGAIGAGAVAADADVTAAVGAEGIGGAEGVAGAGGGAVNEGEAPTATGAITFSGAWLKARKPMNPSTSAAAAPPSATSQGGAFCVALPLVSDHALGAPGDVCVGEETARTGPDASVRAAAARSGPTDAPSVFEWALTTFRARSASTRDAADANGSSADASSPASA